MQPENNSAGAKIVTALIIGLIIGFGAGAFWQERRLANERSSDKTAVSDAEGAKGGTVVKGKESATEQTAAVAASAQAKGADAANVKETAAILASDQAAGGTAMIAQVIAVTPVWVAVREERNDGFGNILGAAKVPAGTHTAVAVELLRPTRAGGGYFVVLYRDVGDAAFNYREDVLIEGVQGKFTAR